MTSLLEFKSQADKDYFTIQSGLKANLDTQLFVQDLYLENETGNFDEINKEMNKLWKKEFDMKLSKMVYNSN